VTTDRTSTPYTTKHALTPVEDKIDTPSLDPLRHAAQLVAGRDAEALEHRIKKDAFASIGRIKPSAIEGVDFETDVLKGRFFAGLPAALQGIAIARSEGMLAFYNRVGWNEGFLGAPLGRCVPEHGIDTLHTRYHAQDLHDLAYVHPRHFEKILGKADAAQLWESLKRFAQDPAQGA